MTTTTPDPITPDEQRVMVRQTVTGFEQSIAGLVGLLTAGPLGALASWGAIRGLQGKWTPWVILGIPAAPVLLVGQLIVAGAVMAPMVEEYEQNNSTYNKMELISPEVQTKDLGVIF